MHLSLVIPFYNEASILRSSLEDFRAFAQNQPFALEFILADDGSTDGSHEIAEGMCRKYPQLFKLVKSSNNVGKGHALTNGLSHASGDYLGFIDCDLEIPLTDLAAAIWVLTQDSPDIVIGNKVSIITNRIRAYHRGSASVMYNTLVKWILNSHLPDHQCGLKLFKKNVWQIIGPNMTEKGWSWDTEFLLRAQQLKMNICSIDVTLNRQRKSKVAFFSTCYTMFKTLLKFRKMGLKI